MSWTRAASGPFTLTSKRPNTAVKAGDRIALRDGEGFMLAVLSVRKSWQESTGLTCYSGNIEGATLPKHPDFAAPRRSPTELRLSSVSAAGIGWWRAGLIPELTGVSNPYEIPENSELAIDSTTLGIDEALQQILLKLEHEGYLR